MQHETCLTFDDSMHQVYLCAGSLHVGLQRVFGAQIDASGKCSQVSCTAVSGMHSINMQCWGTDMVSSPIAAYCWHPDEPICCLAVQ